MPLADAILIIAQITEILEVIHAPQRDRPRPGDDDEREARIGGPAAVVDAREVLADFVGRDAGWGKAQIEDWEAHHYHQPSDQLSPRWNFDGMIEDARLGFYAGLDIADDPRLPAWNPGDEFEAARKKALAAAGR